MKKDSVAFVKASMAAGWSQERVATQLGINKATVSFWLGRRRKPTKKKRSEPKLKPVVVASTRRKAGVGGVSVMLAGGHRVEGLDLEQVVALAKALACS